MSSSDPNTLPVLLVGARNKFTEWRSKRASRTERIPPALWKAATRCAERFGIHPTARALGLDYAAIKRRMPLVAKPPQSEASPFVELVPSVRSSFPECVVELENRTGGKLRIELRGSAIPDLIDLARRFARDEE
jgi:hypothetical protein